MEWLKRIWRWLFALFSPTANAALLQELTPATVPAVVERPRMLRLAAHEVIEATAEAAGVRFVATPDIMAAAAARAVLVFYETIHFDNLTERETGGVGTVPNRPVERFVSLALQFNLCSAVDPLAALVLVLKILDRNPLVFYKADPAALYLGALILATKFVSANDVVFTNSDWGHAANVSVEVVNRIELETFELLDYNASVSPLDLARVLWDELEYETGGMNALTMENGSDGEKNADWHPEPERRLLLPEEFPERFRGLLYAMGIPLPGARGSRWRN